MEIFLFAVSGISMIYYAILIVFTDAAWMAQLYWPVSALVFALIGLILWIDRKRKREHRLFLSFCARTVICTSVVLYFVLVGIFTALVFFQLFTASQNQVDYLIFIESGDVEASLTAGDYRALDYTMEYMEAHEDVAVVLAGCSRFRDLDVDEDELQDLMRNYLVSNGIGEERIITEEISDHLRQNIMYSYAYILVDWYGKDATREEEPGVGVVVQSASSFRYRMIIDDLGNMSENIGIMACGESLLSWPARIMEEMKLTVQYHLTRQFELNL